MKKKSYFNMQSAVQQRTHKIGEEYRQMTDKVSINKHQKIRVTRSKLPKIKYDIQLFTPNVLMPAISTLTNSELKPEH